MCIVWVQMIWKHESPELPACSKLATFHAGRLLNIQHEHLSSVWGPAVSFRLKEDPHFPLQCSYSRVAWTTSYVSISAESTSYWCSSLSGRCWIFHESFRCACKCSHFYVKLLIVDDFHLWVKHMYMQSESGPYYWSHFGSHHWMVMRPKRV